METRHKPKRPGRTDLVVLCDVSGSVANFAQFTLMLVFALREQFSGCGRSRSSTRCTRSPTSSGRAPTPATTMLALAASAAARGAVGPHQLRARVHTFAEQYADALGPRSTCWCSATRAPTTATWRCRSCADLAGDARHAWWLNPEHARHWDTGDSAAATYGELVPMVECRNLTQLGEFVHDLAG